jgi:hypothetical protein
MSEYCCTLKLGMTQHEPYFHTHGTVKLAVARLMEHLRVGEDTVCDRVFSQ